jgi:hypothetical protein
VHPVHVEAVANIIGRAELLACLLGLSALNYLTFCLRARATLNFSFFLIVGILLYFLALLAKESALTFTLIIPLALWFVQRQQTNAKVIKRVFVTCTLLLVASLAMLLLRYRVLDQHFLVHYPTDLINPENPLAYFHPLERALHGFRILGDYILLVIAPLSFSADYSRMPEQVFADSFSSAGLASLITIIGFLFLVIRNRNNPILFWGSWFFLSFALTANILTPIGTIMAERLLFTPSIGAIAFLCLLIYQQVEQRKSTQVGSAILGLMIVSFFTYLTYQRLPVWKNNQTLFAQTLLDAPKSPKALYNYGVYLRTEGNDSELSESYFLKSLEILSTNTLPMIALADIELERKNYARVEYWYRRILALEPMNSTVRNNLEKLLAFKSSLQG